MKIILFIVFLCLTSVYSRVTDLNIVDNVVENVLKLVNKDKVDELENKIDDSQNLGDKVKVLELNPCIRDVDNNIDVEEKPPCTEEHREDNGTALILTPYIEEGRLDEARNASRVDPSLFFGFESYSGFLTVNKTYNSQTFFWYFPVLNKSRIESPWIIWLQGGPGASSMTGLFDEIGPFNVRYDGTLQPNFNTWLRNHSLVFIDNPVGTGFSYTEHMDGYVRDMSTYGQHLYTATEQLIQLFPELKVAPLYIAGESYAGKYVPALGMELHKHRNVPGFDVNLKGLIIGNAFVEPKMIAQIIQPFYHFGLLEKEQIDIIRPLYEAFQKDIAENKSIDAKKKWNRLIPALLYLSYQKHAFNFLQDEIIAGKYITFLKKSEVKRALHVGDIKFDFVNVTVNTLLSPDFLSSSKPLFEELLNYYPVLAYCGQLDQMLPCSLSSERYRAWKWNSSEKFIKANRYPYIYNKKVAGYYKSGGNFTWVVVRGAGHMVPLNAPGPIRELVSLWTHGRNLPKPRDVVPPEFVASFIGNYNTTVYL